MIWLCAMMLIIIIIPGEFIPSGRGLNLLAIVIAGPLSVRGKNISALALNEPPYNDCLLLLGNVIASGFSLPFQYCFSILYTAPGEGVFIAIDCRGANAKRLACVE